MIPNFPQNTVQPMPNYKDFYQNPMQMPMNNQGPMNQMMQPPNPSNFQMQPQIPPQKMQNNNQPNIISSNFIPNKEFNTRKDMFPGKQQLNKIPMGNRPPQNFHHKIDPMSQRSTKIMKMGGGGNPIFNGPRKIDIFKQSNYRKNNNFGQQESLSDIDDQQQMKMPKFMRPPMQMNPKPPMQMRKGKMMNMEPMKMRQPPFFPNFQMDGNMNPMNAFGNNRMGGFQEQMNDMGDFGGFGQKGAHQKKSTLISTQTFFKTKMCPHLINGNCTKGIKCNYAHSIEEIREPPNLRKTKMCQMFTLGRCNLGGNCQFAHGEVELRSTPNLFKTSLCTVFAKTNSCPHGDKCRYAHGEHDIRPPNNQGNQNPNNNFGNPDMDQGFNPQMNFNPNQGDMMNQMPMNFNPNGDPNFQNFGMHNFPTNNNDNLFKNPSGFNLNKIQPNNNNGFHNQNGINNNNNNMGNNGQGNNQQGGLDQDSQKGEPLI